MEKIKRTDAAAKTTEAWWSLLIPEGSLGRTAFQVVWPVMGGAIGAWVASATGWIGSYGVAGWAATITIGALAAIWGLAGFEHVRYRRSQRMSEANQGPLAPTIDEAALTALVDARVAELMGTKLDARYATHPQMHDHDEKFIKLTEQVAAARIVANGAVEALDTLNRQLTTQVINHGRETERHFEQVDAGFAALQNRERHQAMFAELRRRFEEIEGPVTEGAGIANGDEWLKSVRNWRRNLEEWLVVAEYYAMGVSDAVRKIPDSAFDTKWEFESAPLSANQVQRYKEVSVLWQNAQDQKRRVDKQLEYAAFHAPSKRAKNGNPPRPTEDQ